jgi:hypothetical protein
MKRNVKNGLSSEENAIEYPNFAVRPPGESVIPTLIVLSADVPVKFANQPTKNQPLPTADIPIAMMRLNLVFLAAA